MITLEGNARPAPARHEQALAAQRHLRCGARWVASFRGESTHEVHSPLRPEDVARGELFYHSTCCWV